jgi:hypothetical protein
MILQPAAEGPAFVHWLAGAWISGKQDNDGGTREQAGGAGDDEALSCHSGVAMP